MDIADILGRARDMGFEGFGGRCGEAAVAINRVLFDGKGTLVGAFNAAFLDHERLIGHAAVRFEGAIWDADARPKVMDEIESWGMLDTEDTDYRESADACGITWDDEAAEEVALVEFDTEDELLDHFGTEHLTGMISVLERALAASLHPDEAEADVAGMRM